MMAELLYSNSRRAFVFTYKFSENFISSRTGHVTRQDDARRNGSDSNNKEAHRIVPVLF